MTVNDDMGELLDLLVCPLCRSSLTFDSAGLLCTGCAHGFRLHERVPVLLNREGVERGPSLLARLHYGILGNPRLYDFHQTHGGGRPIAVQVERILGNVEAATVLDIGGGTGMVAGLLPPGPRYVWLDSDTLKLRGFLSKAITSYAVLADAAHLPFRDGAADWTVMVEVAHHLADDALYACLHEAARVTGHRFLFVDALRGSRLRSRLLWQLDLGRFPRSEDELVHALDTSFEVEAVERFRVNHDHLLCVCTPRRPTGAYVDPPTAA